MWEPPECLELYCGLLVAVSGLGCNFKHFVVHQRKQGICWLWRCPFLTYLPTPRLNTANDENVSVGLPAAYLPTLTSSGNLFWGICSGFVFPLNLQVCLAQEQKKKQKQKPNKTKPNLLFCSHWYLAGKQKEHKEEKDNHCFFPDDLTHKCSFQCYCCCCVKASYFLRHAKSYFGEKKTGCLLTVLSWGWQWALSWDLPLRLVLASKAPSHAVLIQVMELDRAAFVQGFKKLISLLFYFSGSWNRCAKATVLIAFLSFVCVWFMFPCIILFYFMTLLISGWR